MAETQMRERGRKRYDSITAVKAVSCLIVFTTHWQGAFGGWGIGLVNRIADWGPFHLYAYGSMAVSVFLMLSGILVSLKVYQDRPYSWGEELVRRYLRLVVPVFVISAVVWIFLRCGIMQNRAAAAAIPSEWLGTFYTEPLTVTRLLTSSFITSVFLGDSAFYGPLWMIRYIFFGTVFSIVMAEAVKKLNRQGRTALFLFLAAVFLVIDSFYFCFYLGNVTAYGMAKGADEKAVPAAGQDAEAAQEDGKAHASETVRASGVARASGTARAEGKVARALLSVVVLAAGVFLALEAYVITFWMNRWGIGFVFGFDDFWLTVSGAVIVWGSLLVWANLLKAGRPWWKQMILWIGDRSYSIFLTHWVVICSFSSWFFLTFQGYGPRISIFLNFFLTSGLIFFCSHWFWRLAEQRLYQWIWGKARRLFKEGE